MRGPRASFWCDGASRVNQNEGSSDVSPLVQTGKWLEFVAHDMLQHTFLDHVLVVLTYIHAFGALFAQGKGSLQDRLSLYQFPVGN